MCLCICADVSFVFILTLENITLHCASVIFVFVFCVLGDEPVFGQYLFCVIVFICFCIQKFECVFIF